MEAILQGVEIYWFWVCLACLLLAIEVLIVPSGFFLCLGTSAGLMAALAYFMPDLSRLWMLAIYSALMVASCLFWMKVMRRRPKEADSDRLSQRSAQLVGERLVLREGLKDGRGRVWVKDSPWPAEADADYPAGTRVEITEVRGITLRVKAVEE